MLDERGRVWLTATVRPPDNPAFCKAGSSHPSAQLFPLARAGRHLAVYDPKTQKLTHISTCFSTHHLMFAEDANRTIWTSGGGPVVGWLNTRMFDATGDEEKSQGWTALILDTNGNGKRDAYVEPDEPVDPTKDKRIAAGFYAVAPAPDGSVWGTALGFPGAVVRLSPGSNPPETALAELYELPLDRSGTPVAGFSPRGGDKDGKWVVLRVPYPLGFYTKWLDGRIDDPNAGWKGRGLWATVSTRAPFHMEGGKGTTSKVLKFQLRPDPLAK